LRSLRTPPAQRLVERPGIAMAGTLLAVARPRSDYPLVVEEYLAPAKWARGCEYPEQSRVIAPSGVPGRVAFVAK